MIIIGPEASALYSQIQNVGDRLRDVKNGGELLILGQRDGWLVDLCCLIYPAQLRDLIEHDYR
jgi:hypothetical protein